MREEIDEDELLKYEKCFSKRIADVHAGKKEARVRSK